MIKMLASYDGIFACILVVIFVFAFIAFFVLKDAIRKKAFKEIEKEYREKDQ